MNIYEKHLVEIGEAQVAFNEGVLKLHEVYAESVHISREALLHALTGDKSPPVDTKKLEQDTLDDSHDDAPATEMSLPII